MYGAAVPLFRRFFNSPLSFIKTDDSTKCPASVNVDCKKISRQENTEMAPEGKSRQVMAEKQMEIGAAGLGFIQMEQFSPPLYGDSKDIDGNCSDPSSSQRNEERHSLKRPLEDAGHGKVLESSSRCMSGAECHIVEAKRKKKSKDGLSNIGLEITGHPQTRKPGTVRRMSTRLNPCTATLDGGKNLVLCGSTLSTEEKNEERYSLKRLLEDAGHGKNLESSRRCISGAKCQTVDVKRQKKTHDGLNDIGLEITDHPHTNISASGNLARARRKPLSGGQSSVDSDLKRSSCAFCHSSIQTERSGPLLSYAQGKEVMGTVANFSKVTQVHDRCMHWSPRIFFKDDVIQNLESEVARASKLKCSSCGKKGAALGCYVDSCQNTYHVPCAMDIFECRWDSDHYLLLCPNHASRKFPSEQKSKTWKRGTVIKMSTYLNQCTGGKNLVLRGSALSTEEKFYLAEFARSSGETVSKYWRPEVTHVPAATDSDGACMRTMNVLLAILNGKWVVTMEWVKACMEAGRLVDEEPYEVALDNHGCSGGPKAGRLRVLNNAPKLFNMLKFYFNGEFVEASKIDFIRLVTTAGGTVITRDQLLSSTSPRDADEITVVVYNTDITNHCFFDDVESLEDQRSAAAQDLAQETGSKVVGHTWILESIAACSLLPFT